MKNSTILSVKVLFIICGTVLMIFSACKKSQSVATSRSETPILPFTPFEYLVVEEEGQLMDITNLIHDESNTMVSNESVTLGRVLFYDTKLSINNTISCGSCHKQALGFADNTAASIGFSDRVTPRNSMAIQNVVHNNNMFWDSRAQSPMELSMMPVFNHLEMGMETDQMLESKLAATTYYPELFEKAFGNKQITKDKIALAMTHFVNCLFSKHSKFDEGMIGPFGMKGNIADVSPSNFTPLELEGKKLFFSEAFKCSECHAGFNFAAPDFAGGSYGGSGFGGNDNDPSNPRGTANIGLDFVYKDNGRGNGKFKIPSLRNIVLTGPYMHDGRFKTLNDVLNHYSHGIKNHPSLDDKFKVNGVAKPLNMSEGEKMALISFLNTLTDPNLTTNPKFSDPFVAH
jgi:cytochrome c peroxidase